MSLRKQLWLAIVLLLTLVFSVSFLVTTLSAKTYLQQQLSIKNSDNAAALALSLSQQGADDVLLELTIAAQFDTGFYELIELADPDGNIVIRRQDSAEVHGAPQWFAQLFPIAADPGYANLQAGWRQVGTLKLLSHSRFAYQELWHNTLSLALIFLVAGALAGVLGSAILSRILKPLDQVVDQAQALQQRRFVTMEEPATLELQEVAQAMNSLSVHFKTLLDKEARQLEAWQQAAHIDTVTGLTNREPFLANLKSLLGSNDLNASGTMALLRLTSLDTLNQTFGRAQTDAMLLGIGGSLQAIAAEHSSWSAARLNGSEFALLAPRELEAEILGTRVHEQISGVLEQHGLNADGRLPGAVGLYSPADSTSSLLARLDTALSAAESDGASAMYVAHTASAAAQPVEDQTQHWRNILTDSLNAANLSLLAYPVVDSNGALIHEESPVCLQHASTTYTAGQFLPWVNRLLLSLQLDKTVVQLALSDIASSGRDRAINLTVAAVVEETFVAWLDDTLRAQSDAAKHLWLELPEAMAFRHFEQFRELSQCAKRHGARLGIEHVGHQLVQLGRLHDVGLDFLKIDASFVRDIDGNTFNQTLIGTLCTLGHSVGVQVIAEGVESADEAATLAGLGIDGLTGPQITREHSA